MRWRLRYFWESVRNLWRWAPLIWRDRDYDYGWLLLILAQKLRHMRQLHEQNRRFVGVERTIRQLRIAEHLCRRLADEWQYCGEYWEKHFEKYPFSWDDLGRMERPSEEKSREVKWLIDREEHLKRQDIRLLCKLLERHYRSWWD